MFSRVDLITVLGTDAFIWIASSETMKALAGEAHGFADTKLLLNIEGYGVREN
jgi:hypothetical protein